MREGYFVFPYRSGLAITGKFRSRNSVCMNTDIVKYLAMVGVCGIDFTGHRTPVIHFSEGRQDELPCNIMEYLSNVRTRYVTHCHIVMVDE